MRETSKPEIAKGTETLRSLNDVTNLIIGAAIEVHRHLGPGLLESAYEECLCYELSQSGLSFRRQVPVPVQYKGVRLDCDFRLDLVVEDAVIVEVKAVERLAPIHSAQLHTYLKVTSKPLGLLMNFNVPILKQGLKRISNHYVQPVRADAAEMQSLGNTEGESPSSSLSLSQRLCVSAVKGTVESMSPPEYGAKRRVEALSLPQRRRDAEEKQSLTASAVGTQARRPR